MNERMNERMSECTVNEGRKEFRKFIGRREEMKELMNERMSE